MAKWFQHLTNDGNLGKVVQLSYIDDVQDDDMVIYYFSDGSKCNKEFIADFDNMDAFNGKFVMAEIQSPNNIWRFEKKNIDVTQTHQVQAADGNVYDVPEPGISLNGQYKSDIAENNGLTKGTRIQSYPPKVIQGKRVEECEQYMVSVNPNIIHQGIVSKDDLSIFKSVKKNGTPIAQNDETIDFSGKIQQHQVVDTVNETQTYTPKQQQTTPIVQPQQLPQPQFVTAVQFQQITIDIDSIMQNSAYSDIQFKIDGNLVSIDKDKVVETLKRALTNEPIKEAKVNVFETNDFVEDVLVKNLIDKAKKNEYSIGMELNLDLPPKDVYKTIKAAYDDDISENFVTAIAMRMKTSSLKKALADGLKAFYDSEEQ